MENYEFDNRAVFFEHQKTAHIVAQPEGDVECRMVEYLDSYLSRVTGVPALTVRSIKSVPAGKAAIVVSNNNVRWPFSEDFNYHSDEAYTLKTGVLNDNRIVAVSGASVRGLKRGLQRLIILSQQKPDALVIPPLNLMESPWISQREWILCPWEPSRVRGVFRNTHADTRLNIYTYGKDDLARYVEMFDWFGFSGCQLVETCVNYAAFGSKEAAQEWLGYVIDILHKNGQDVSLWVWAAQFTGYGWDDSESKYQLKQGQRAFNDPNIRAIFEKNYDSYVRYADKINRLIAHFYDPGELTDRQDVFAFMKLLESKAKAKNPAIQMGIDMWAAEDDFLQALINEGFEEYLLLPVAFPPSYNPGRREQLHKTIKNLGLRMGYWGWYQTEMETDQLPSMYVNAKMLKDFYNRLRSDVFTIYKPQYYSEMEAHHFNNIYSMYASAQLLWNPDRDPDMILTEITEAIWGAKNAPLVQRALELIQDVRTGPTWETYWWTSPAYRLGTEDPESDFKRAQECIAALGSMKTDVTFVPKIPLPVSPSTLIELMMPHLKQILHYSKFRIDIENFKKTAKAGISSKQLQEMLQNAWHPVPEFSTWVGTMGTIELRMQRKIIAEIEKEYAIHVNDPPYLVYLESDRLLQQIQEFQRQEKTMVQVDASMASCQFYWSQQLSEDRFERLIKQGLLVPTTNGKYRLADWENWAKL